MDGQGSFPLCEGDDAYFTVGRERITHGMHSVYSRPREARRQLPLSKAGQARFYKGGRQCCSQVQEIAASQAGCERDRQCLSRCDRMAAAREPFISVQDRRNNYIFLMQKKKTTSQREARSHEIVPSALVCSKSGGAGESCCLPLGLWWSCSAFL